MSHWGRVLGPVGLVLLIASILTFMVSGDSWLGQINIVLGLVGIAIYFATNFRELNQFASSRGTFFMITSAVTGVVIVGGLVAANYIVSKHPKTWDLTANKIHTLSDDTQKTLGALTEPVQVTAFFQPADKQYEAFDDLFKRYRNLSDKFEYKFVDPLKDPIAVKDFNVRETGPRVIVKLGAIDQRVTNPTEEELTNAIVRATHTKEKKVYFVTGHGEVDIDDKEATGASEIKSRMENEGLKAESLQLVSVKEVPKDAELVVVAGPAKPMSAEEVKMLSDYLDQGGKMMVLLEPLMVNGLDPLLKPWGITVDKGIVMDLLSQLSTGNQMFVAAQQYGDSEITKGFKLNTAFPTVLSLSLAPFNGVTPKPLVYSLRSAWVETNTEPPFDQDPNEKAGPLVLAAVATKDTKNVNGSTKRSDEARLVVFGDRDFFSNKFAPTWGNEDLALNSLNWLANQTERISIRPRQRDASRIYLTAAQMGGIRFFATELPIALLAFGLAIYFNRRAK
jgi:ABC-type uncharacterized transport system involved in gliding motility auxiliary subunit